MPIKVTCPKCQGVLHAPDDAGGKRGKCPTCGTVLSIPASGGGGSLAPSPLASPPVPPMAAPPRPASLASMPDFGDDDPRGTLPAGGDMRRSSFTDAPKPAAELPEPRRAQQPGRLPPPTFGPPPPPAMADPRKASEPFVKPGKPAPKKPLDAEAEGGVKAWKRARRGLLWIQFALFLFLLAPLGLAGVAVAEKYGAPVPNQSPGYMKIDELSAGTEIRAALLVVPVILGLLCLTLGRFGLANAPRWSAAKGLTLASATATLMVLLGLLAVILPTGAQVLEGFAPEALLPADELTGLIQRIGLGVAIFFLPLSEIWGAISYGRIGAALKNSRLAGRSTRFHLMAGLSAVVVFIFGAFVIEERAAAATEKTVRLSGSEQAKVFVAHRPLAQMFYAKEIEAKYNEVAVPQWNKLGDNKLAVQAGLVGFAGLFVWFMYSRLVGGARRAIREWLNENDPAL